MKKILVVIMIFMSLVVFGLGFDINVNGGSISFSKNMWSMEKDTNIGLWLSYPMDFTDYNLPGIGINYNDKNEFFTYQKVFFKKIKLKTGERYFGLNIGYDFERNSIVLSTKVKKYKNDLISKRFSYSYISVFKNGSEERKIGLDRYLIPTVAKVSIFSTSYDNLNFSNSISNYGIQLQRYFTIPFVIGNSDLGYSFSIPIGIFDNKYMSGYFAYGVLYKEKYFPFFNFQVPFKINKNEYYMGMQLKMANDADFLVYLSKLSIDNPFSVILKLNENGKFEGGFFFEY
ncbi:hypothetical protein [Marinitoga lauensis]|uniref:hypothetical protein n=1 Tax=Marinitoga lauensis TaxID=2201189 RepID=UPI00101380C1|nr:hypothetical protein [Marinitoga lauensis]